MKNRGNMGIQGAVMVLITIAMTIYITVTVMGTMEDSFGDDFNHTDYSGVFNDTNTNAATGLNLQSLAPILIGAGMLIGLLAVFKS